jgi:hypothetical protein
MSNRVALAKRAVVSGTAMILVIAVGEGTAGST